MGVRKGHEGVFQQAGAFSETELPVLRASRKPGGFLATARVEKGLPKGPNFFLHHSERLVQVKPLNEHTNVVTFRVGPGTLLQALQPIAHQLRLAQILHHRLLSRYGFLSPSLQGHLPIDHERSFYACGGVVSRD
jgi:hypothetical protein